MNFLIKTSFVLLATASIVHAQAKSADWSGPESVTWEELGKGVAFQVKSAAEPVVPIWIVTSDPALAVVSAPADSNAKSPVKWNGGAVLNIKLNAAAEAKPANVDRAVWIAVMKKGSNLPVAERKVIVKAKLPRVAVDTFADFATKGWLSPLQSNPKVCFDVPVSDSGPIEAQAPAFLKNSFGGAAKLTGGPGSADPSMLALCLQDPPPGVYTGKYTAVLNGLAANPVDLSLTVSHGWALPVLVAAFGVFVAWRLKQSVNVERATSMLLRRAAEARVKFENEGIPAFAKIVEGDPSLQQFTLSQTPQQIWQDVSAAIGRLKTFLATKIDEQSLEFTRAAERIQLLESLSANWPALGTALRSLKQNTEALRAEALLSAAIRPPQTTSEPACTAVLDKALQPVSIAPSDVAGKLAGAGALNQGAIRWKREHQVLLHAYSTWLSLANAAAHSGNEVEQEFELLRKPLAGAWVALWSAEALAKPVEAEKLLTSVLALKTKIPLEGALRPLGLVPEDIQPPTPAQVFLKGVEAEILSREIWLTALAFVIALTAGMSSSYLGQAFGSIKQYVELFLWGAGVKTGLDLLTPLLEQIGMAVGKAAPASKPA